MDQTALLIFIFFGFGLTSYSHAAPVYREYHHVNQSMNWADAQHYCRVKHTDLATIGSLEDANRLNRPSSIRSWIWIGLTNEPSFWRWSATGGTRITSYQNWHPDHPNLHELDQACVHMDPSGRWKDSTCRSKGLYFICYDQHVGEKVYTLLRSIRTWMDAQTYCRKHHTDLAMIENEEENSKLFSILGYNWAWLSLYRGLWTWSDKSKSSFKNWQPGQPSDNRYCVAENSQHQWSVLDCNTEFTFWCHGALKVKTTMVRMKIQTNADLSNPAMNTQILQQLGAAIKSQGLTDFKLRWKIKPKKEKKRTEL